MSTEQSAGVTETTDHLKLWWFIIKKEKYLFTTNIILGNNKFCYLFNFSSSKFSSKLKTLTKLDIFSGWSTNQAYINLNIIAWLTDCDVCNICDTMCVLSCVLVLTWRAVLRYWWPPSVVRAPLLSSVHCTDEMLQPLNTTHNTHTVSARDIISEVQYLTTALHCRRLTLTLHQI